MSTFIINNFLSIGQEKINLKDFLPLLIAILTLSYSIYNNLVIPKLENDKFKQLCELDNDYLIKAKESFIKSQKEKKYGIEINKLVFNVYIANIRKHNDNMKSIVDLNKLKPSKIPTALAVQYTYEDYVTLFEVIKSGIEEENTSTDTKVYKISKKSKDWINTQINDYPIYKNLEAVSKGKILNFKEITNGTEKEPVNSK